MGVVVVVVVVVVVGTARSLENLCIPAIRCAPGGCYVHQQTTVRQGWSPVSVSLSAL